MEAISYAKKYLILWQETHLTDILHANALIAFNPKTTCLPYKVSTLSLTNTLASLLFTESVYMTHPAGHPSFTLSA